MKKDFFCVAVYHPYKNDFNGEFDSFTIEAKCTKDDLAKLKTDDDLGYIELVGWLPIEHHNGTDRELNENFIRW
jgi:hypothetical protein